MTCERCGKEIIAPEEYGDFYVCEDCSETGEAYYPEYEQMIEIKWR